MEEFASMNAIQHSLGYAFRSLARTPGFTLTTLLTLAVAIGASTAIFSVVNGVLLKPLPFPDSDRLVSLTHRMQLTGAAGLPASPAIYFTYRDNNRTFESVALWVDGTATITGAGRPEQLRTLFVTHEFLDALGVRPILGRSFAEAEDQEGGESTVILSYPFWQRNYGGAEDVLGQRLVVDGTPRTVIGVLPRDFRFSRQTAELLARMQPARARAVSGPLGENGIARLKPGVTLAEASADVERMIPILLATFPLVPNFTAFWSGRLAPDLQPLKQAFVRDLDDVLRVLMGTVGLLLLIACANIANLMLVRTQARAHDLAVRTALGATRAAIARILLLESLALGLVGGALGLVLAAAALPALLGLAARDLPAVLPISIDPTVLAFTLSISLGSGAFFGVIPALKYAAPQVAAALAGAARSVGAARERQRATDGLVVAQVAIALVLLVGSGLMIRTYASLQAVDAGFEDPQHLLTVDIGVPSTIAPGLDGLIRMQRELQDRLAELGGVEAAAYASRLPLEGFAPGVSVFAEDERLGAGESPANRPYRFVSPGFFAALGTPLRAGRAFEWRDVDEQRQVAVVSEKLARAIWGGADAALGKHVRVVPNEPWREIVGVVGDVHQTSLDRPAEETVYVPQNPRLTYWIGRNASFVVRSARVGTAGFLEDVQRAVSAVDRDLALARVGTMEDAYRQNLARRSLTLALLTITATMAFALGLLGIYAVISHRLAQRTREIGVRIALGAGDGQIQRMLLGRVLLLVAVGVALGLGGAAALTRFMTSMLFGVTALDAPTFAAVTAALVGAALLAGYLPARRVTRIDPMQALRTD